MHLINWSSVRVSTSIKSDVLSVCCSGAFRRKEMSNDLREAIVAAHQSGKGYKSIFKQLTIILQWKHSRQLRIFPVAQIAKWLALPSQRIRKTCPPRNPHAHHAGSGTTPSLIWNIDLLAKSFKCCFPLETKASTLREPIRSQDRSCVFST